jgi:UDP-N-acetyl-D-glucosamine dehydrogenase
MARRGKSAEEQRRLLASERATVGVIGLGYVGLPLCLTMADAGKRVVGLVVVAA